MTELLISALLFALLMGLFYGVEHWAEVDIDEHEELTRQPDDTENNNG